MITTIRKHQRWLLLLVAIMTIIAFAWLYNTTDTEKLGENQVAQLYGKTVYRPEVDRVVRLQRLALLLGLDEFLRSMSLTATSEEGLLEEFVWNLLVLRHQSEALFLQPTDDQVLEAIRTLPALSRDGQFDRTKYMELLQSQLAPNGLTERHLEELIRDSLRLDMLRRLLNSPLQISNLEEKEISRALERIDAQLIKLGSLSETKGAEVTAESVTAFFQENQASLQTPEFRQVAYVKAGLSEAEAGLEGRARIEALQKVADRVAKISEEVVAGKSLAAAAEAAGISLEKSGLFDAQGLSPGDEPAVPGAPVGLPDNVVADAFRLASPGTVGEVIQDDGDFYLVELVSVEAPRPLTEEEVAPRIREMLEEQNASLARQIEAAGIRSAIETSLAGGRPLAELAQEKNLTVVEMTGLEPWKQTLDERTMYARSVAELSPGQLSEVSRDADGLYVLVVTARQEPSAELLASEGARMRAALLESKQMLLLAEWLRSSREAAGLRYFQQGS